MNAKCVKEYISDRIAIIQSKTMTDTITWHWIQAGMPIETVGLEAIHNIVAFSQFDHTVQLLVTQSINPSLTPGTGGLSFLQLYRRAAAGIPISFALPPPYYNFSLYNGTAEELKLNVVREYMRIMLPNNLWFSKDVTNNCTGCSQHTQTRHIPQMIQIRGEYEKANLNFSPSHPWSPAGSAGWTAASQLYGRYDPMRYTNFMAKFSDASFGGTATSPAFDASDLPQALASSIDSMTRSPIDNETVIPTGEDAMFPVFTNPIYAPFGLGARRCPGETFNQFLITELFETLQCLQFYDDCTLNPDKCLPASPMYQYTPVPLAPFKAVPDSLFVLNTNCPA
jgi:hypothetical protein